MEFLVYSRQCIEAIAPNDEFHFIISITTPKEPKRVRLPVGPKTLGILHLQFHDLDDIPKDEIVKHEQWAILQRQWKKVAGKVDWNVDDGTLFNPKMATEVVKFAIEQKKDPRLKVGIVHCDGGWSRSPGVAAGLMKTVFEMDDSPIFAKRTPNMRVFRHIVDAYAELVHGPCLYEKGE